MYILFPGCFPPILVQFSTDKCKSISVSNTSVQDHEYLLLNPTTKRQS